MPSLPTISRRQSCWRMAGSSACVWDEVVPSAPIPFEEARDQVDAAWRADALAKALSARAIEIKAAIEGGAAIGSFGIVDVTPETARDGFITGAPETLLPAVFAMSRVTFGSSKRMASLRCPAGQHPARSKRRRGCRRAPHRNRGTGRAGDLGRCLHGLHQCSGHRSRDHAGPDGHQRVNTSLN